MIVDLFLLQDILPHKHSLLVCYYMEKVDAALMTKPHTREKSQHAMGSSVFI